ncbi:hypothetical protein EYF80_040766 [Liparis tanakae]|uniref:Uncharacterized protein n=1 Tax=Liparis tanakae TaxID=230148 RepID=A0A4Z2G869_9TELE|nr:hypothetical protein EYF80_040766 [Liparis tanakae]
MKPRAAARGGDEARLHNDEDDGFTTQKQTKHLDMTSQVSNTRPAGRLRPTTSLYAAPGGLKDTRSPFEAADLLEGSALQLLQAAGQQLAARPEDETQSQIHEERES